MKKVILFAAILLAGYTAANAQVFVGGSFGFHSTSGDSSVGSVTTDSPSSTSFTITPKVGYYLNDKFAIGVGLGLTTTKTTTPQNITTPATPDKIEKGSIVAIAPFVRYTFAKVKDFSFFAEGTLALGISNSSITEDNLTTDAPKVTVIGLNITPAVSYALTEKFELEAAIKLFDLTYTNASYSKDEQGVTSKGSQKTFNLEGGLDNIVTLGTISISAIYKF